jgi:hypothetical protein
MKTRENLDSGKSNDRYQLGFTGFSKRISKKIDRKQFRVNILDRKSQLSENYRDTFLFYVCYYIASFILQTSEERVAFEITSRGKPACW